MRLIKFLGVLIVAGLIGLAGYAFFGDMTPERRETRMPIAADGPGTVAATPAVTANPPVVAPATTAPTGATPGTAIDTATDAAGTPGDME